MAYLARDRRCQCLALTLTLLCCARSTVAQRSSSRSPTMYDVLQKNPAHRLLMLAIDADKDGSLRDLLKDRKTPITALVPTNAALVKAAMRFGLAKSVADMKGLMHNSCLVTALLRQHVIPGRYTYQELSTVLFKPSYLITKKWDSKWHEMVKENWPIIFHTEGKPSTITVSSAAWNPTTNAPVVNGTIVEPYNIKIGAGIMHTINQLLVPTTNLTQLLEITNCTAAAPPS